MPFLGALAQPVGRLGLRGGELLGIAALAAGGARRLCPCGACARISSVRDWSAVSVGGADVVGSPLRFGVLVERRLRVAMR